MGIIAVKIKLMPVSPDVNLQEIRGNVEKIMEKHNIKNPGFEKQPIAFGLNALIVIFAWPEEKELEDLETELKNIKNVNSARVVDIRRAIG